MLGKQAKILSDAQIKAVLSYLETTRNSKRDKVIFLLSVYGGLRAKEISNLQISMITGADNSISGVIALEDKASKGRSGRSIPMNKVLQSALTDWLSTSQRNRTKYVINSERSEKFSANGIAVWFKRLYRSLDFQGASSHSGRRGFITQCARNVSRVGGSIRDVMALAGHSNLQTTEKYISQDVEAQKNLVNIIYQNVR